MKVCCICQKKATVYSDYYHENQDGSFTCQRCYLQERFCSKCGKVAETLDEFNNRFNELEGKLICRECYDSLTEEIFDRIIITSTNNIEGYTIEEYFGIDSVEIVIGTGWFSEFTGELSDLFGLRSTQFEVKLQDAKSSIIKMLKKKAMEKGANAVIGVDLDYIEFSGNRVGIILNGTMVKISKKK